MRERTVTESEMRRLLALSIGRKSVVIAFLLWLFFGWFGVHRFYLDKVPSGIALAFLSIVGWYTTPILIGFPILFVAGVWWLLDFLMILFTARRHNQMHDELIRR